MEAIQDAYDKMLTEKKDAGSSKAFQAFFNKSLKDAGYDSVKDIPADKKDDFFNQIDKDWNASDEKGKDGEKDMNEAVDDIQSAYNKMLAESSKKETPFKEDESLTEGYIESELKAVMPVDKYGAKMQISSSSGKTKHININEELIKALVKHKKSLYAAAE